MNALYVLGTVGLGAAQRRLRRPTTTHHYEDAVLKDIVELADREGRSIRTALRLDVSPEDKFGSLNDVCIKLSPAARPRSFAPAQGGSCHQ